MPHLSVTIAAHALRALELDAHVARASICTRRIHIAMPLENMAKLVELYP